MNPRQIFNHVFSIESIIAGVVFALILGFLLVSLVLGRRRHQPSQKSEHPHVELVYTLVVVALAAYLITSSIGDNDREEGGTAPAAVAVKVTGFQWCWRFAYRGTNVLVTADCLNGRGPVMTLPSGVPVRLEVTSADVVHEMWVPYLRFKMEAVPGYTHSVTMVLHRDGIFAGRCSEFCGIYHYAMVFQVHVVSDQAYKSWLAGQEKAAAGKGAAVAGKSAG